MPAVNKPDFFIVGAPKCGTTALYTYLSGHPDIGMSRNKEPNFFTSVSYGQQRLCTNVDDYLRNFDQATGKTRIGEASPSYFASPEVPERLLAFSPAAQIIVMMRNPVDVLHALHSQMLFGGAEHITRFELAVDSQETRYWRAGPFRNQPVVRPGYRAITKFSEHLQRYFDVFGRARVHVIWLGDFVNDPVLAYAGVLSFLGLRNDGRSGFTPVNGNKRLRSQTVARWSGTLRYWGGGFKRRAPEWYQQIRALVERLNVVRERRPEMDAGFRRQLEGEYAGEIKNLERLLGRTLVSLPVPVAVPEKDEANRAAENLQRVCQP